MNEPPQEPRTPQEIEWLHDEIAIQSGSPKLIAEIEAKRAQAFDHAEPIVSFDVADARQEVENLPSLTEDEFVARMKELDTDGTPD